MPRCSVVGFDLDGTLYSSEPVLGLAYAAAMRRANTLWGTSYPIPTSSEILAHVGRPVREIFERLFPSMSVDHRVPLANQVLDDLVARIRAGGGFLYPEALSTLAALRERGYRLVLVSNCRRAYLEAVTETFELAPLFDVMVCNEDDPALGKPGLLAREVGGAVGVMVGDRRSDGEAAREAGIRWIACDFGHTGTEAGEWEGADAVITSLGELLPIVADWSETCVTGAVHER